MRPHHRPLGGRITGRQLSAPAGKSSARRRRTRIVRIDVVNSFKESDMRSTTIGSLLVCATALAAPAAGENPPLAHASVRTILASPMHPTVEDTSCHYKTEHVPH